MYDLLIRGLKFLTVVSNDLQITRDRYDQKSEYPTEHASVNRVENRIRTAVEKKRIESCGDP